MQCVDVGVTEKRERSAARELLKNLGVNRDGCVLVVRDRICWSFYLKAGKIVYATHSLESFERLERHLRGLSREVPTLDDKLRSQLRLMFDDTSINNSKPQASSEIICNESEGVTKISKTQI